jgi:hypothetical protein
MRRTKCQLTACNGKPMTGSNCLLASRRKQTILRAAIILWVFVALVFCISAVIPASDEESLDLPPDNMASGFIFFRIVEHTAPPRGWEAFFFYINDCGVVQVGKELDKQLVCFEWTSTELWDRLVCEVPLTELSDPLVPQPHKIRKSTEDGEGTIELWVVAPGVGKGGWMGDVAQAGKPIQAFNDLLVSLTASPPDSTIWVGLDASTHGFMRCARLDEQTKKEFKKDTVASIQSHFLSCFPYFTVSARM